MNLIDFCYVKDNSLDDDLCDKIIDAFTLNADLHERYDNDRRPNFTQFNLTGNKNPNTDLHKRILDSTFAALNEYRQKVQETAFWPRDVAFEQFRIKHYRKQTEDQFDYHVDSIDQESSKRFLAFFWYLNDVDVGGDTEFPTLNLKVSPKKGRLFVFPPMWLYPHRGTIALSHDKYLLSSYLHFT